MECIYVSYTPADIIENPDSTEVISHEGFTILLETEVGVEEVYTFLQTAPYVSEVKLSKLDLTELEGSADPADAAPLLSVTLGAGDCKSR